uniref:Uncharacterized protein n=1 Tax=Solanum tuberosum TaxID=4113 RepID=M0ZKE3_SOLTU
MASTKEEQLASLTKAIEGLTKCAHEQDAKLYKLTNKMDNMIERRSSQTPLKLPRIQDEGESCIKQTKIKEIHLYALGLIPFDQLKDFIVEDLGVTRNNTDDSFFNVAIIFQRFSPRQSKRRRRFSPAKKEEKKSKDETAKFIVVAIAEEIN